MEGEEFQMKFVEKIKTYISCERLFSQKSCHL